MGFRRSDDGPFHRIERIDFARGQCGAQKIAHAVIDVATRVTERDPPRSVIQHGDCHAVLGESAGLVHGQHGGGAQRLDRRHAAGQHVVFRKTPGADGQEHREHDGEFFRQDAHRERDPCEGAVDPVAAQGRIQEHHRQTQNDSE